MFRAHIAFVLLTALPLLAQTTPKPFLQQSIEADSQTITGNYSPLDTRVAPKLQLKSCNDDDCETSQPIPADFSFNVDKGLFTAHLDKPVSQKTIVYVELTANGATLKSDRVKVSNAPSPPVYLSSTPVFGAASVKINFKPIAKPAGKTGFKLEIPDLFNFTAELDPKDLAAGSADVKLPTLLLPPSTTNKLKITPTAAGIDGNSEQVTIIAGSIQLDGPIKPGSKEITGTAYDGAKMVCLGVFGEAFAAGNAVDSAPPADDFRARSCIEAVRNNVQRDSAKVASLYPLQRYISEVIAASNEKKPEKKVKQLDHAKEHEKNVPEEFRIYSNSNNFPKVKEDKVQEQVQEYVEAKTMLDKTSGPVLVSLQQPVDPKSKTFKFTLPVPVDENASVLVREVFPDAPGGSQVALVGGDLKVVDPAGLEFGQVRASLTIGAALSQSEKTFSNAAPYVAFNLDGKLLGGLIRKNLPENLTSVSELYELSKVSAALHWTAGVRLTQTGTVSLPPTTLQSVRSGVFFAGLYVPLRIRGMDYIYRGVQYSSFVAPLVKVGVTAVDGGVLRSLSSTTTVTKLIPCPRPLVDCSAFDKSVTSDPNPTMAGGPAPFWGYGFRAGLMKYSLLGDRLRNRQVSADPIMYLDVTWGQNQVYVNPGLSSTTSAVIQNAALNTQTITTTTRKGFTFEQRLAVEARMKIPYVPIEIGADVNMNRKHPVADSAFPAIQNVTYSDYRFIIGFRLDAAKTLYSLFGPKN